MIKEGNLFSKSNSKYKLTLALPWWEKAYEYYDYPTYKKGHTFSDVTPLTWEKLSRLINSWLVLPHVVLVLEDDILNPLRLKVLVNAIAWDFRDDTIVVDVRLSVDIAAKEPHLELVELTFDPVVEE